MSLACYQRVGVPKSSFAKNVRQLPVTIRRQQVRIVAFRVSEIPDIIAKSFLQFLTPPKDTITDWKNTTTNFSGKVSHSAKKPFQDGFITTTDLKTPDAKVEEVATEPVQTEEGVEEYLGGAARRLMGHNFTGDGTEPKEGCGTEGWTGDIHSRNRDDGFHSKSF